MHGWYPFRPWHGGRSSAHHLLQVTFVFLSFSLFAQGEGDGFTESDRSTLRGISAGVSTIGDDVADIYDSVLNQIQPKVADIEVDVADIKDALDTVSGNQSYFNQVQQNMYNMMLNWEQTVIPNFDDLPLIQQNTYNSATHLSYIRTDTGEINTKMTESNGHLTNIEAYTGQASLDLDDIKQALGVIVDKLNYGIAVTNVDAFAQAFANSSVSGFGGADMGMVTNIAVLDNFFLQWMTEFPDLPFYPELLAYLESYYGGDLTASGLRDIFASTPTYGLPMALLVSALRVDPDSSFSRNNLFDLAYDFWFGDYSYERFDTILGADYSIFDAYNTLGLGVLTNQANSLISQGDFVTNALSVVVSNLFASLSVSEKTRDALYNPEDSEPVYGTNYSYSVPEWVPTYQTGIDDNTNHYYYFEQADYFTRSLIGNYTSLLGRVVGGIKPQKQDLNAKITWSGWSSMQGQYGGWDLDLKLPQTPDVVDFAKYVKFLSRLVCFVLDLCIVLLGAKRIHQTVMGGKLPFEE